MNFLYYLDFSLSELIKNPIDNKSLYNVTLCNKKMKTSNFVEITDSCPNFVSFFLTE